MSEGCSSNDQDVQIDLRGSASSLPLTKKAPSLNESEPVELINSMPDVSWSMVPQQTQVSWWNSFKKSHGSKGTQSPKTKAMHKVFKKKASAQNSSIKTILKERTRTKCSEKFEDELANNGGPTDEESHSVSMNVSWVEGDKAQNIHQEDPNQNYASYRDRMRNELMEEFKAAMMTGVEMGIKHTLRARMEIDMAGLEARLMEKLNKSDEMVEKLIGGYSSFLQQMSGLLPRFALR